MSEPSRAPTAAVEPTTPAAAEAIQRHASAAFFDFDKTLLHGDAGVIFGRTLSDWGYQQGRHITDPVQQAAHHARVTAAIARIVGSAVAYRMLNGVGLMKRSRLVELSYRFLAGFPAAEMSERMERVWNERLHELIYPEMIEIIERHRAEGRRIVIVTTGLRELVEHSKKTLGEDIEVVGVEMLRDDEDVWLGRVEGPLYGRHKADTVKAYAKTHGIDLSQSYAYSDHYSDMWFLGAVGNPVCVNPQLRLALHARKKGWPVLRLMPPTLRGGTAHAVNGAVEAPAPAEVDSVKPDEPPARAPTPPRES